MVTNDEAIATGVRILREHGGLRKFEHDVVGFNSRLDSLQAAILNLKLPYLEVRNELRRRHARTYDELLAEIPGITTPFVAEGMTSVYNQYVIHVARGNRDDLQRYLRFHGIQTAVHYPGPIYRTPAFAPYTSWRCPTAERAAAAILSLPIYPEMETRHIQYVADIIRGYRGVR